MARSKRPDFGGSSPRQGQTARLRGQVLPDACSPEKDQAEQLRSPGYLFRTGRDGDIFVSENRDDLSDFADALQHAAGLALKFGRLGAQYHGGIVQVFVQGGEEVARLPIVAPED